jgi:hypothetical protein
MLASQVRAPLIIFFETIYEKISFFFSGDRVQMIGVYRWLAHNASGDQKGFFKYFCFFVVEL